MKRIVHGALAGVTLLATTACADFLGGGDSASVSSEALLAAFSAAPVASADLSNSFVGTSASATSDSAGWLGRGQGGRGPGHAAFMGGGLGDAFAGGIAFNGRGGQRGPFGGVSCTGTFNTTTGRLECAASTLRNGLAVTRSIAYASASGAVQQAFDTLLTNTVNVKSAVTGTLTLTPDSTGQRRGNKGNGCDENGNAIFGRLFGDTATLVSATNAVQNASDRTVTGLASGSTQRTVNGASAGTENISGVSSRGNFTVVRVTGDTTSGLVIPVSTSSSAATYPTAGTVIRSMKATLTYEGQAAVEASRREVITYDGTATAKVELTENGTTKSCTRALPRGQLVCS